MSEEKQESAVFNLDKIYVKDLSLEIPHAPHIFLEQQQPNVELNLNFHSDKIDEGVYQTTLHAVVDAKINGKQMFLIEVDQVGIFQIRNVSEEQLSLLQNIECTTILFPYLRETVSDLVIRAGFLPILLSPVNFAYLYQQKQQAQETSANHTVN